MNSTIRGSFLAVVAGLSLFACSTTDTGGTQSESSPSKRTSVPFLADTAPNDGQPVFLGIGPRLQDRDEEVEAALLHAADQISRYLQISAVYEIGFDSGGRTTLVKENIVTEWQPERGQRLIDSIDIIDQFQDADGTYLLVTSPSVPKTPYAAAGGTSSDRPTWVDTPPTVPGFYVSVGVTRRRRAVRDSIDFADEDALKGIIMSQLSQVVTQQRSQTVEEGGTITSGTGTVRGTGRLTGFLVISRWVSTDGQYFYSLAIAPIVN